MHDIELEQDIFVFTKIITTSRSSPLGVNGHAGSGKAEFQQILSHYDSTLSYNTQSEIEKHEKQTEEWKLKRNAKTSSAPAEKSGKTRRDASGKWKRCLHNSIPNGSVPSPAAFIG